MLLELSTGELLSNIWVILGVTIAVVFLAVFIMIASPSTRKPLKEKHLLEREWEKLAFLSVEFS